jgi:hypothetical protein
VFSLRWLLYRPSTAKFGEPLNFFNVLRTEQARDLN